jgi:hypothetical protein
MAGYSGTPLALSHGRVDVKVCAVDDTWSAPKNLTRPPDR